VKTAFFYEQEREEKKADTVSATNDDAKNVEKMFSIKLSEHLFHGICLLATILPLAILAWLLADTIASGLSRISLDFIFGYPSRFADKAGIFPSLVGSLFLLLLTSLIALHIGIASAIYLEEYARDNFFRRIVEVNIANLAGVPSVIIGLLGLEIFVRIFGLGNSLIAGACTLSLLILPVIVTAAREALKTVPNQLREAAFALGASKLSVVIRIVLPLSLSQILTGAILSISRAMGESAPLIVVGAATYLAFLPDSVFSDFSALPLQIFHWVQRPQQGFADNAAGAIIVLLIMLACFNGLAAWLRHRSEK
jgi:phosphate transport system permease protein